MQATRLNHNCATGKQTIDTYEIPDPTPEELAAQAVAEQQAKAAALEADLTQYIDDVARKHTWCDIGRAIAASNRPGPFQANAIALADWWEDCWVKAHEIKAAAVAAGAIPDKAAFLAQMPTAPEA